MPRAGSTPGACAEAAKRIGTTLAKPMPTPAKPSRAIHGVDVKSTSDIAAAASRALPRTSVEGLKRARSASPPNRVAAIAAEKLP